MFRSLMTTQRSALCGTDVPEQVPQSSVAAHMSSQVIDRKETCEFVVIVNDNQPVNVVCCQYVSRLGEDIVFVATNRLGRHEVLDLSDVRVFPLADATDNKISVRDHANNDS